MLIKVTAIVCMADILSKARCEIRNKCEFSLTILYMYIFEKKKMSGCQTNVSLLLVWSASLYTLSGTTSPITELFSFYN